MLCWLLQLATLFRNFSHACTKRREYGDQSEACMITSRAIANPSYVCGCQKNRGRQVCRGKAKQPNRNTPSRISLTQRAFTPQQCMRTRGGVVSCGLLTLLVLLLYRSLKGVPMHYLLSRIVSAWYYISPILEQACRLIDTFATCRNLIRSITKKRRSWSACGANECQKLYNNLPVSRSRNF